MCEHPPEPPAIEPAAAARSSDRLPAHLSRCGADANEARERALTCASSELNGRIVKSTSFFLSFFLALARTLRAWLASTIAIALVAIDFGRRREAMRSCHVFCSKLLACSQANTTEREGCWLHLAHETCALESLCVFGWLLSRAKTSPLPISRAAQVNFGR